MAASGLQLFILLFDLVTTALAPVLCFNGLMRVKVQKTSIIALMPEQSSAVVFTYPNPQLTNHCINAGGRRTYITGCSYYHMAKLVEIAHV